MDAKTIQISEIKKVNWTENNLIIEYQDGSIYHYFNVTYKQYRHLVYENTLDKELGIKKGVRVE